MYIYTYIHTSKRHLRFEVKQSYFVHLVISHTNSDLFFQKLVQSWFTSIPSGRRVFVQNKTKRKLHTNLKTARSATVRNSFLGAT